MAEVAEIVATLRKHGQPRYEWRVQSPVDGAYCMHFEDWGGERQARDWLDDHRKRHPQSQFAGYVVARVQILDEFKDAALAAADILAAGQIQVGEAINQYAMRMLWEDQHPEEKSHYLEVARRGHADDLPSPAQVPSDATQAPTPKGAANG